MRGNAGPHRDVAFMKYVVDYCERFGWYWEPQGPQMPHINVLDLAVFPKMSRNHCELVRKRGGTKVLKEDELKQYGIQCHLVILHVLLCFHIVQQRKLLK